MHGPADPEQQRRGEAVYEPFAGSGTTIIAAEATERRCLAMEVDPRSCDVVVRRWQGFTGGRASLAGEDRWCDDVASSCRTRVGPPNHQSA